MKFIAQYQRSPNSFKERLIIKAFKESDKMYDFLYNAPINSKWQEIINFPKLTNNDKDIAIVKSGIYAYAGGQWHNVKSLDISVLAYI